MKGEVVSKRWHRSYALREKLNAKQESFILSFRFPSVWCSRSTVHSWSHFFASFSSIFRQQWRIAVHANRRILKVPGHMGSATSHRQSPTEPNATVASSEDEEEQDHGIQVDVKSPKELVFVMVSTLDTFTCLKRCD